MSPLCCKGETCSGTRERRKCEHGSEGDDEDVDVEDEAEGVDGHSGI